MQNELSAEEIKNLIAGRILDEYRKHPDLDWSAIASGKLYSQWDEYYGNQITSLKKQVDTMREAELHDLKIKVKELEAEIERLNNRYNNLIKQLEIAAEIKSAERHPNNINNPDSRL